MKKILVLLFVTALVASSCVHQSRHCKKAYRNVKRLHLENW